MDHLVLAAASGGAVLGAALAPEQKDFVPGDKPKFVMGARGAVGAGLVSAGLLAEKHPLAAGILAMSSGVLGLCQGSPRPGLPESIPVLSTLGTVAMVALGSALAYAGASPSSSIPSKLLGLGVLGFGALTLSQTTISAVYQDRANDTLNIET